MGNSVSIFSQSNDMLRSCLAFPCASFPCLPPWLRHNKFGDADSNWINLPHWTDYPAPSFLHVPPWNLHTALNDISSTFLLGQIWKSSQISFLFKHFGHLGHDAVLVHQLELWIAGVKSFLITWTFYPFLTTLPWRGFSNKNYCGFFWERTATLPSTPDG